MPNEPLFSQARLEALCTILCRCGFDAQNWRGRRLYVRGYGRDISASLIPGPDQGERPLDGWRLAVKSSWRAPRLNGFRCKGVMHAILSDLYQAGLISVAPPERWQDVRLDVLSTRPIITRYEAEPTVQEFRWPLRQGRDPYAPLRALHQSER